MTDPTRSLSKGLAPYRLTVAAERKLRVRFHLLAEGCDLAQGGQIRQWVGPYAGQPGTYFWILRASDVAYKLYIGQTTSLSYRLSNYTSRFQPNATNDFKLRIALGYFSELALDARFDLYFAPVENRGSSRSDLRVSLRTAEKQALELFTPVLLNVRGRAPEGARASLEQAYVAYYRANLHSLLSRRP